MSNFRVTTNGVLRNYRTNLHESHRKLNDAMTRVETHRQFNSFAEDPSLALRAFQTRRSLWRTSDQLSNNENVFNKFSVAFTAIDGIVDGSVDNPGFDGIKESLGIITDSAGSGRKPQGQVLLTQSDAILKTMNTTYGDSFIFAGSDGLNAPYTWGENGEVLYRGLDVDNKLLVADEAGILEVRDLKDQTDFQKTDGAGGDDKDAYMEYLEGITGIEKGYQDQDDYITELETAAKQLHADAEKLKEYAEEATYVDIGLGMEEDENGNVVPSSAYNSALTGLDFMSFGVDEDGDSRNFISLMRELGQMAYDADPDSGEWSDPAHADRAFVLTKKLRESLGRGQEAHAELQVKCQYLQDNQTQLETTEDTLQTQRESLESIDPADAITDMLWAQYCYNAALRIGNDVLSQSLLDYMN